MSKFITSVILLILVTVTGCKKNLYSPNVLTIQQFPVSVGDYWIYLVLNTTTMQEDTATITVISKTAYPNDSIVYFTRTVADNVVMDSGYIISSRNTFAYTFNNNFYTLFANVHLTFPMATDSTWKGQNSTDSIYVLGGGANDSVNNYGSVYYDVFSILRQESTPNYIHQLITICPNVGIVYETITDDFIGAQNNTDVYLLSYHLN